MCACWWGGASERVRRAEVQESGGSKAWPIVCASWAGGVVTDGESLFLADCYNHRVQKFRLADGAPLVSAVVGIGGRRDGITSVDACKDLCSADTTCKMCMHSDSY